MASKWLNEIKCKRVSYFMPRSVYFFFNGARVQAIPAALFALPSSTHQAPSSPSGPTCRSPPPPLLPALLVELMAVKLRTLLGHWNSSPANLRQLARRLFSDSGFLFLPKYLAHYRPLGVHPIAMSVTIDRPTAHLLLLLLLPLDGCSTNPTRSCGPSLVVGAAEGLSAPSQ